MLITLTLEPVVVFKLPPEIDPIEVPRVMRVSPIIDADTPPFSERAVTAVAEIFAAFRLKLPEVIVSVPVIVAVRVPAAMLVM